MPEMPLSPCVSETQRKASPHTTIPSARVIIRKYTPSARIASNPKTAATKSDARRPAPKHVQKPAPRSVARIATA